MAARPRDRPNASVAAILWGGAPVVIAPRIKHIANLSFLFAYFSSMLINYASVFIGYIDSLGSELIVHSNKVDANNEGSKNFCAKGERTMAETIGRKT